MAEQKPIPERFGAMSGKPWVLVANRQLKRLNMGKKRIITTQGNSESGERKADEVSVAKKSVSKTRIFKGVINIFCSYNNIIISVADQNGQIFVWSSAGTLGFKGARKSTPYAATLVGKDATEKAKNFGLQEAKISVKGIGPGREGAIRGVVSTGINITSIIDNTPIAHNGVKPAKPRSYGRKRPVMPFLRKEKCEFFWIIFMEWIWMKRRSR